MNLPAIIQGGMGIGISNWQLARSVSQHGQLGVVSGTAINSVLIRRLQLGDKDGAMRSAMEKFPFPEVVKAILDRYFVAGGKDSSVFKRATMYFRKSTEELQKLTIVASFVEVFLAKAGHVGSIGINFLEKTQLANLPGIYGAMLAGVDYVLMGAGIPKDIPEVLDRLVEHKDVSMNLTVDGATSDGQFTVSLAPATLFDCSLLQKLKRPKFFPIISSVALAQHLLKKANGTIDGFVVEHSSAGGHNAPPRGALTLDKFGEPIYGPRDEVDFQKIRELNLPFWFAGSFGHPQKIAEAQARGAQGVQVGSAFALCEESGLERSIRESVIDRIVHHNDASLVFTDPFASPSGYPFKVFQLPGTLSEESEYQKRRRNCDLGYLRKPYVKSDGTLGYRCPAEDIEAYVKKGGAKEDTEGRKCLCNSLFANIGLAQAQDDGTVEKPLVTLGNDVVNLKELFIKHNFKLTVKDVIRYLLPKVEMG